MRACNLAYTSQVVRLRRSGQGLRVSGQGVVRLGADHFKCSLINTLPCETAKWSDFWQACIGCKNILAPVPAIYLKRVASLLVASVDSISAGTFIFLDASKDKSRAPRMGWS